MDNVKELFVSFFGYNTYVYVAAFITVVIASLKFISWVQKTKKKRLEIIKLKIDILHKKRKDDLLQLDNSEQAEIKEELLTLYDKANTGKRKRETNMSYSKSSSSYFKRSFNIILTSMAVVFSVVGLIEFFGILSNNINLFDNTINYEDNTLINIILIISIILDVISTCIYFFRNRE